MKEFKETLTTAVFTTTFVIYEKTPITNVFHYQDGSWQFSGSQSNLNESDYKIISLGQAIDLDRSILEVSDIPLGFTASRLSVQDTWVIEALEEDD